jgi:hypothetical protein
VGLEINKKKKTKFKIVARMSYSENEYLTLGTYNFERVEDYACIGTILSHKNELRPEIKKIVTYRNRAYYLFLPLL